MVGLLHEKEIDPLFIEECTSVVYNMEVLKHFGTESCLNFFLSKYFNEFSVKI